MIGQDGGPCPICLDSDGSFEACEKCGFCIGTCHNPHIPECPDPDFGGINAREGMYLVQRTRTMSDGASWVGVSIVRGIPAKALAQMVEGMHGGLHHQNNRTDGAPDFFITEIRVWRYDLGHAPISDPDMTLFLLTTLGAKPEPSWLDRQQYMDKLTAICDRMDMRLMETGEMP